MRLFVLLKISLIFAIGFTLVTSDTTTAFRFSCDAPSHPDYSPLMALYNATDGPNWTNNAGWGEDCDVCNWYGVSCNSSARVWRISLLTNNLSGSIPTNITDATELEQLILTNSNLSGPFPTFLKSLSKLNRLDITNNQFSGPFPQEINDFSELEILAAGKNNFGGNLIPELFELPSIENLDVNSNELVGGVPSEVGLATSLTRLVLSNNNLGGELPMELYQLTNLDQLQLVNCGLQGTISEDIMNFSKLSLLYLAENNFSGPLPDVFDFLPILESIDIQKNRFSGSIPSSIGSLSELIWCYLQVNDFTGTIPSSLGNLASIQRLDLGRNELVGEIPESFSNLSTLRGLQLNHNNLEGAFPAYFANFELLTDLNLRNNLFEGCFPDEYTNKCGVWSELNFTNNCTFENPRLDDFCNGSPCDNSLGLEVDNLVYCPGEIINISLPKTYVSYQWSDGDPDASQLVVEATQSQYFSVTVTTSSGCTKSDSIFLEVITSYPGYEEAQICSGQTVSINGEDFNEIGVYEQYLPVPGSCDSTVIVTITEGVSTTASYAETICFGTSTEINGETFGPGMHEQIIPNQANCDSIIAITIDEYPEIETELQFIICDENTYDYLGDELDPGNYSYDFISSTGCDSTVLLTITQSSSSEGSFATTICEGSTIEINGENFPPGQYEQVIPNEEGCDSIIAITISGYPAYYNAFEFEACQGDFYEFDDDLLSPGTYFFFYSSINGCDSIIDVVVNELTPSFSSLDTTICSGSNVEVGGVVYESAGEYELILQNSVGCDSTLNISIQEYPVDRDFIQASICDGTGFNYEGEVYTAAGNYVIPLENRFGCDSIIELQLDVISGEDIIIEQSICAGNTYTFNEEVYSETTYFIDSIFIDGCKSLVIFDLQVTPALTNEFSYIMCEGDVVNFHNQLIEEEGSYLFELKTEEGCDSLLTIHVEVNEAYEVFVDTTICEGSSVRVGLEEYTQDQLYTINLKSQQNCDSLIYLNINYFENSPLIYIEQVCAGEEYPFLDGNNYAAGIHTGLINDGNCDRIFELEVQEVEWEPYDHQILLCFDGAEIYKGIEYSSGGIYPLNITEDECKLLESVIVVEASGEEIIRPQFFCQGTTIEIGGELIEDDGIYLNTEGECGEEFFEIYFMKDDTIIIQQTINTGESYELDGELYSASGTYVAEIETNSFCDATVVLTLEVIECGGQREEDVVICDGDVYYFFDQIINSSGIYEHRKVIEDGCDSIIRLIAQVNSPLAFDITGNNFICPGEEVSLSGPEGYSYLWSNGSLEKSITVSQAGSYSLEILDENQCSSFAQIELSSITLPQGAINISTSSPSDCNSSDGSISINVDQPETYLFSIDNGLSWQESNVFTALENGPYAVVITDTLQRCFKEFSSAVVLSSPEVPQIEEVRIDDINICVGSLGMITIVPEDDKQAFEYSIDGGLTWSTDSIFDGLGEGSYNISMRALGSGCINNQYQGIEIYTSPLLNAQLSLFSSPSCETASDGAISLEIESGTPPYQYLWSNGQTGQSIQDIGAGIYKVTVSDVNDCVLVLEGELLAPSISESLALINDTLLCSDSALLYNLDTSFEYTVFFNDQFLASGAQFSINEPGDYQIIVNNGSDCVFDQYFTVSEVDLSSLGIDFLLATEGVKDVEIVTVNVSDPMPDEFNFRMSSEEVEVEMIDKFSYSLLFPESGTYTVYLETAIDGCVGSIEKEIVIYEGSTKLGTFTPKDSPLDIEQFGKWTISPNPNNGQFIVEVEVVKGPIPMSIGVYDLFGSLLQEERFVVDDKVIKRFNLYQAGTGIYNVVLRTQKFQDSKQIFVLK